MKRALCAFLAAVFVTFLCCLPVIPLRGVFGGAFEVYVCSWADGRITRESFTSAFRDTADCTEEEIILLRGGVTGAIATGDKAKSVFLALHSDTPLAELLALNTEGATRLERAALTRKTERRLWYDGDWFCWEGDRLRRTAARAAEEVVFISGTLATGALIKTKAVRLILGANAQIGAGDLCGSAVSELNAYPPFVVQDGALYTQTVGGKKLIAALPHVKTLTAENYVVCERGALSPCAQLEELTIPFAGNFADDKTSFYCGEFAYLFEGDVPPASLKKVTVTGGALTPYAFYGCATLREINACGVSAARVSPTAFYGLANLRKLHSPRADIRLSGSYSCSPAPCGCTVFDISSG